MVTSFTSRLGSQMEDFIQHKIALGYSRSSYDKFLALFDRFCLQAFPEERSLTQPLVMQWVRLRPKETANGVKRRMVAIREFGKYLNALGLEAYVLPSAMIGAFQPFVPSLFSDEEFTAFFAAADSLAPHKRSPYRPYIVPVLFRLLYCCGLRPHEVRMIRCADVNGETGSIYIRDTKVHRDRIVVMSFFCCWNSRGRPVFQDRVKLTFPHVFTKKCGFQAPKRELAQNFTPTISAKNPGACGRDPFSPRQTVVHSSPQPEV